MMARRDLLIEHFDRLIEQTGGGALRCKGRLTAAAGAPAGD